MPTTEPVFSALPQSHSPWTAAATRQLAREQKPDAKGHGVFTAALLGALRNGDTNRNGKIELSELVAHVQAKVPKLAEEARGEGRGVAVVPGQTARFGSRGEDFVIVDRLQ